MRDPEPPNAYNPLAVLPGKITISYPRGGAYDDGGGFANIRVLDEASGAVMFETQVDIAAWGLALSGVANTSCRFIRGALALAGKCAETKTELVPRITDGGDAESVLAPFEVDGWRGDARDLRNAHRWRHGDQCAVTFRRYVDSEDTVARMAYADATWAKRLQGGES